MPRIAEDLTGKIFGRLLVIKRNGSRGRQALWFCQCDCNKTVDVTGPHLKNGDTKSCGCLRSETTIKRNTKHGQSYTRIYKIWTIMRRRCTDKKHEHYHCYGGRGIKVCSRWLIFENFHSDMGDAPKGMSIDRVNNNGDYEPNNCRWATKKQQANNSRSNTLITYNGKTQTMKQWAEEIPMNYQLLCQRINRDKWPIERAFTQKPLKR